MPARQRNIWKIKTSLLVLSGPGAVSFKHNWDRPLQRISQGANPRGAGALKAGQDRFHNDKQQDAQTRASTTKTRTFPPNKITTQPPNGGAGRDRTDDILLAKQALSQLSYGPERDCAMSGGPGRT
jgi:hypothetical protein